MGLEFVSLNFGFKFMVIVCNCGGYHYMDPVGLIQVPKVASLPLEALRNFAASACRVFCRFLTATADEQLREDSTKEFFFFLYSTWSVSELPQP